MREPTAPAYCDRRAPEYDDWYLGDGVDVLGGAGDALFAGNWSVVVRSHR